MIFRMVQNLLSLDLELDDRDHLVHLGSKFRRDRVISVGLKDIRLEKFTRVIAVDRLSERCKRS